MNLTIVHRCYIALLSAVMVGSLSASAQNIITLDVGKATYTINKEMYGGLLENLWDDIYNGLYVGTQSTVPNVNGMRKDVIAAFKECGVAIMDWPGGCAAEQYDWRNGIGPKDKRPPAGDEMVNGMGTEEYFQLCDSLGAKPYITANTVNLSPAGMAAWLNYIDSTFPNKLKYWKMGNEPWGGCGNAVSISGYIDRYNRYKAAISSKLSGKFKRIADGGTADYLYKISWIDSLMKCEMGSIEGVTLHYYGAFPNDGQSSIDFPENEYYDRIKRVAWNLNSKLEIYDSIMAKYDPDYTVELLVDEWGSWHGNVDGEHYPQSTCRDAVIASVNLNMFNNRCRRIKMACVAQPVNVIQSLLLTEKPATTNLVKTPTFYVYKMYKVHQLAKMVPSTIATQMNQDIPLVTTSSSVDSTGKLHISMCNTHVSTEQNVTITLNNAPDYTQCTGTIINGDKYNSYNDFGIPERVNIKEFTNATLNGKNISVKLPAHSVVTLELTPKPVAVEWGLPVKTAGSTFNVVAVGDGSIRLNYVASGNTPFSIALHTLDGRSIIASHNGVLKQGSGSFVWQSGIFGANVYVVKTTFGDVTKSQCVMLDKK